LVEERRHQIIVFIDEPVPELSENCIRAFRVPFDALEGRIEIASIADTVSLEIPEGRYAFQIEFMRDTGDHAPQIHIRFNQGRSFFSILKADESIQIDGYLDLLAEPAT